LLMVRNCWGRKICWRSEKLLTVRKNLLTGIHMIIAPANASRCVTTTQTGNYVRLLSVTCLPPYSRDIPSRDGGTFLRGLKPC
jgi:hypothetical protein